jgi:hypothetical protein
VVAKRARLQDEAHDEPQQQQQQHSRRGKGSK